METTIVYWGYRDNGKETGNYSSKFLQTSKSFRLVQGAFVRLRVGRSIRALNKNTLAPQVPYPGGSSGKSVEETCVGMTHNYSSFLLLLRFDGHCFVSGSCNHTDSCNPQCSSPNKDL